MDLRNCFPKKKNALAPSSKNMLKIASMAVLLGWAWHLLWWEAPFRALVHNPYMTKPLVELLGGEWSAFVQRPLVRKAIHYGETFLGLVLLLCGLSVPFAEKGSLARSSLVAGGGILVLIAFVTFLDRTLMLGCFFEFAAQILTPFILYKATGENERAGSSLHFWLKAAIALTFLSHGLFAIGYYPVPGNFMDMVIIIFDVNNDIARQYLQIAGIMDFLVAVGILFPRIRTPFLVYAVIWGFLTALARPMGHYFPDNVSYTLTRYLHEFVLRTPHFLLPVILLWMERATPGFFRDRYFSGKKRSFEENS